MKKIRFLLCAFVLGAIVVSCNTQKDTQKEYNVSVYNEKMSCSNDYSESTLIFSAIKNSSSKALTDSVNNWILKCLADSLLFYEEVFESWDSIREFKGNKDSLLEAARYYTESKLLKEDDRNEWHQEANIKYFCFDSITIYPNKGLTSVIFFEQTFTGGAHPNALTFNATFDNETGHIYDFMEIISDTIELKKMIIQGLKKHYKVSTEEELRGYTPFSNVDYIPLPQASPYFMEDKLVIQYQQYEIAPYSAGAPQAIIPLKDCEKILNPEILKKVQSK